MATHAKLSSFSLLVLAFLSLVAISVTGPESDFKMEVPNGFPSWLTDPDKHIDSNPEVNYKNPNFLSLTKLKLIKPQNIVFSCIYVYTFDISKKKI